VLIHRATVHFLWVPSSTRGWLTQTTKTSQLIALNRPRVKAFWNIPVSRKNGPGELARVSTKSVSAFQRSHFPHFCRDSRRTHFHPTTISRHGHEITWGSQSASLFSFSLSTSRNAKFTARRCPSSGWTIIIRQFSKAQPARLIHIIGTKFDPITNRWLDQSDGELFQKSAKQYVMPKSTFWKGSKPSMKIVLPLREWVVLQRVLQLFALLLSKARCSRRKRRAWFCQFSNDKAKPEEPPPEGPRQAELAFQVNWG
jgi:hypothetical protein